MENNLKVGQVVRVPESLNFVWAGDGVVTKLFTHETKTVLVRMTSGSNAGNEGGFDWDKLEAAPLPMSILSIKRSNQKSGLKVYGKIQGEFGKTYSFAYFRRPTFRGWLCTCENFMLSRFAKRQNCKHLNFVRKQVGRYAATVPQQ